MIDPEPLYQCTFKKGETQYYKDFVSVQWVSKTGGRPSLACLGASPTSRAARYARAQLVKGLRTRFRRVAATRARMPWLRLIVRNWILVDPLNAYFKQAFTADCPLQRLQSPQPLIKNRTLRPNRRKPNFHRCKRAMKWLFVATK